MPDNDKLSMASSISTVNNILGVSNKSEMNTSEELLTNSFSDSESGSTKSLKSPEPEHRGPGAGGGDTSVGTGSLTLEQFTEIVLAQEKMEVTDDKRTEVTINNRNTAGVFGGFQHPQGATKMKTVVLTPRHANTNVPSAAPRLSPVQMKKSVRGPVTGFQDLKVRDQMRKQLETVIRKNEEILEQSNVTHVASRRGRDAARSQDSSRSKVAMPLNLSVRKDLMKKSQCESDKSDNVNVALEKLIARHGRELEITRKTKKDKLLSLPTREPPPDVDLTPVTPHKSLTKMLQLAKLTQRPDTLPALIPITAATAPEPFVPSLKRPATFTNNNVLDAKKKKQEIATDEEPTDLSVLKIPENKETVQRIMMDCKIALQEDTSGNLPLHNAVVMSNVKLVRRFSAVLSALGRSLDIFNKYGETPLHIAVKNSDRASVSELLKAGARPGVPGVRGDSALHTAVRQGSTECLESLLNFTKTEDLNIYNDSGETCLHSAVISGQISLVRMLLAAGVNPDLQCVTSGKTGLFLAVENGHQAIAETLICYGANLTTPTYSGNTPASLCTFSESKRAGAGEMKTDKLAGSE